MKEYKIKDEMYRTDIRVLIGGNNEEVEKYIKNKYEAILEPSNAEAFYFTLERKGKYNIDYIWLEKFNWEIKYQGILVHEILHLTFSVMNSLGIKYLKETSEEAYTYYFQHIFEQVFEKLKPENKVKKKKT